MIHFLLGSLIFAVIHASIPNHWLPLVVIGRTERWTRGETLRATAVAGIAHTSSTILIGIVIGFLGFKISESYQSVARLVAPLILIALGIYNMAGRSGHSRDQDPSTHRGEKTSGKSKVAIITSLSVAMFFSPCIEIEAYYFSAGMFGWLGIALLSGIYLTVTVSGMLLLVDLARSGVERMRWDFMERNERRITGIVLILSGVAAYFVI